MTKAELLNENTRLKKENAKLEKNNRSVLLPLLNKKYKALKYEHAELKDEKKLLNENYEDLNIRIRTLESNLYTNKAEISKAIIANDILRRTMLAMVKELKV